MSPSSPHPKWWQLYLTLPLLIVLFLLDQRLRISTREHEVVQIGIVLIVYGLIYWWLKANSGALSHKDRQQYYGRMLILQAPPPTLSESNDRKHSLLQIPNAEVKGILSTTYEIDYIDVDAIPIEEDSQETNKD